MTWSFPLLLRVLHRALIPNAKKKADNCCTKPWFFCCANWERFFIASLMSRNKPPEPSDILCSENLRQIHNSAGDTRSRNDNQCGVGRSVKQQPSPVLRCPFEAACHVKAFRNELTSERRPTSGYLSKFTLLVWHWCWIPPRLLCLDSLVDQDCSFI